MDCPKCGQGPIVYLELLRGKQIYNISGVDEEKGLLGLVYQQREVDIQDCYVKCQACNEILDDEFADYELDFR